MGAIASHASDRAKRRFQITFRNWVAEMTCLDFPLRADSRGHDEQEATEITEKCRLCCLCLLRFLQAGRSWNATIHS
jgi:hypothetical protein